MLEERNQGCGHGCDLVRSHIHKVHFILGHHREVCAEAALDPLVEDVALLVHLHIGEGYHLVLLFFSAHVEPALVAQVHLAVLHLAVRGLDEAEVADPCIYAEG